MPSEALLNEVYDELRVIACQLLAREHPGHTLQPTALVHEAFLKMQASYPQVLAGQDRRAFFACAAESMRRILVDQARRKKARKRGGKFQKVPLEVAEIECPHNETDPETLSLALDQLRLHDAEIEELVKLCYFIGMPMVQVAEVLGISLSTANRRWRYAKAWLKDFLDSQ